VKIISKHFLLKFLKITGIAVAGILLLLFLLPILFPGTIGDKVKNFANERLDGELNFSKVRLSFFSHFPSFTVSLYDFSLKGSAPFKKDSLLAAEEIAFGVDLSSLLFDKKINIDKIFI
jgi:AsmA protein